MVCGFHFGAKDRRDEAVRRKKNEQPWTGINH